jgi:hypothetical protein
VHDTIVTLVKHLRDSSLVDEALDVQDGRLIRPASDLIRREVAAGTVLPTYPASSAKQSQRLAEDDMATIIARAMVPRCEHAEEHMEDLTMASLREWIIAGDNRRWSPYAPSLSLTGPRGFNLLSFCSVHGLKKGIMISRAGWLGLAHEPWRDTSLIPKGTPAPDDEKWSVTTPQWCPLCGKKRESPYHFLIDCLHAEIVAARAVIREQLRVLLPKLAEAIVEATKQSQLASRQHMSMLYSLLQMVKDEFREEVPVEDFLLYRMLLVLQHPAFLSPRHAALGAILDWARVLHPQASKPANLIAKWATASIRMIAAIRLRNLPPGYYEGFKEQVTRIKEARKRESRSRARRRRSTKGDKW